MATLLSALPPAFRGGATQAASNPFAGIRWYYDPSSAVVKQAAARRSNRPIDAALLDVIARADGRLVRRLVR